MTIRIIIFLSLILLSCAKENKGYETQPQVNPYEVYKDGFKAFDSGDFFYAQKKFSEAELNFEIIEFAAKASLMSSYCLYGINFYSEAIENLNTHIKKYPADKNIIYAYYLMAIIYFEQIADEKKDVEPLLKAKDKIDFFIKKYPDSVYSLDLKFKKDLIINQIAAKELYVAKYYISVQKWIPAINRLKIIVKDYDKTIFIEEALHRLVEIHYFIGLEDEAKKYASILGYNYNSSQWFEQSYKVFNKKYKLTDTKKDIKKDSFIKKIIKKIK
jgi:outer membrane protein assembly factor BamD